MITYRCEKCSVLVQAADHRAGRPVACSNCKHVTTCPRASVLAPLRPPPEPPKPRKVGNPDFFAALGAIGVVCVVMVIILH